MTNHTDDTDDGVGLKRPLGPTGETVRANIIRLRAYRRLGYTEPPARPYSLFEAMEPDQSHS